ncbi:redoxin domain-containing protein [Polaribacter tangerinus]|uniref:redoxin domain-containing protein n=1 Tax=Polaribacter tangerinus TaxID=1920034 RepID=UPI000B4BED64|nr:redoxin domain-containing protein [Polaribacter tangerinus]
MKKFIFISIFFISQLSTSQNELKDIEIQTINDLEIPLLSVLKQKKDNPIVLFTWAKRWCSPCVNTLDKFNNNYYEDLKEKYNLKFVALNLDTGKNADEIKKFVIDREWYFDIYKDPEGNYMKKLNINSAPQIYLIVNNKIINYKSGFVDGVANAETTANYIYHMIKAIGNVKIYYDEKWNYTNSFGAKYVQYTDYIDNEYLVQIRWISGELNTKFTTKDKWLSEKTGLHYSYFKDGKKNTEKNYVSNKLHGKYYQWYNNGQLWVEQEYNNGKLQNINQLFSETGKELAKGTLVNGNGYIFRYNLDGKKVSKQEYKNGQLDGMYTTYDKNGKVVNEYLYSEGSFIKKMK